jgi:hypothetical protein
MPTSRLGASFRDRSGFLFREDGRLLRHVAASYAPHYTALLDSGLYEVAVSRGLLIPHQEVSPPPGHEDAHRVLAPDPVPFISYPYEWSFGALKEAALLTLMLQRLALDHGMWLKDASAYNVQFHRGAPVLIDTLSFEIYPEGRPWVAYRQFCRHFLAPLSLVACTHADLSRLSRLHVDGVPLDLASRLLPWRTWLRFSLLTHVHLHGRLERTKPGGGALADRAAARGVSRTQLIGLIESLERAVRRLVWRPRGTEWADYYGDHNYTDASHEAKAAIVRTFLERVRPACVWDLGANTGRFSRLASERGAFTVAFDADPAAVEKCYRQTRDTGERALLPLVMDLTNPSTALGWDGRERMSLSERGPADLIMALALVHHLAISNNVPLEGVARFLHRLGSWLVIEFVPKSDSQVQRLLAAREDIFVDYDEAGFEAAFGPWFERMAVEPIPGSARRLYLLRARRGAPSSPDAAPGGGGGPGGIGA